MATVTQVKLTCDVCGDTNDVKTRTFGLDGKTYEIDLCRKDGNALGRVAARYVAKAQEGHPQGGSPPPRWQAGGGSENQPFGAASGHGQRGRGGSRQLQEGG